jgi:hypothetical protein
MSGYSIIDNLKIEAHITFVRINPTDIKLTLRHVFDSIANTAWISSFDQEYIRNSYNQRALDTIKYISSKIIRQDDNSITSDSGECIVSELARKTVVEQMGYLDIPLGELIKYKTYGNHGFDFFTVNNEKVILFGEAKYLSSQTAYGNAFKQIVKFESVEKKDVKDIVEIDRFCCDVSKSNHANGRKGFMAAFSSKNTSTEILISGIRSNLDYSKIKEFEELICIAVDL